MIFTETEEYTLNGSKQNLPGFEEQYHNIVDFILKITEEIWEERAVWRIYDTYAEDILIHSGADTIHGVQKVVSGTIQTLYAFPDRKMNGEAVIWSKVDDNHFYSSHRIGSVATNLGPTQFGDATGKKIFFRTIADCLVSENRVVEEWLVRDNLHLIQQLGFDPVEMAKRDTRYVHGPAKVVKANPTAKAKEDSPTKFDLSNPSELIQSLFENVWSQRAFEKLSDYYHLLATVHSVCEEDVIGIRQLSNYLQHLFASFPDAVVQLERISCNERGGSTEVAARWKIIGKHTGDGFFDAPSGKEIVMPGISHYIISGGKVEREWMVFDGFDVLCQIHADAEKIPMANINGQVSPHLYQKNMVNSFFSALNESVADQEQIKKIHNTFLAPKITLNITKPFTEIQGSKSYLKDFWLPLLQAFPDVEIQPYILMGGNYEGRHCVSATGNFVGTFKQDWLGIPATQQPAWIRFAAHYIIENNKITQAWYFLDILDLIRQAGFKFLPSKGIEWIPPGPITGDGIVTYPTSEKESQKSMDLTNAMLNGLGSYDGKTLDSMAQENYWDVQNMMWYGPSGIGTTKGLKGFQENHQLPFITAFPDRGITSKDEMIHFAQYGDGNYSCDFGFPSMYGTHNGDGWLGLQASGRTVTMRVVDFWRREGDRLKENWVFIDMIHLLEQLGVDIFKLLHEELQ